MTRLISRRDFLGAACFAQTTRARPNILLIYTDQQRHDTIAALGNRRMQTPNLDRLVREGVAFTHATTPSPVCVAARCSLQAGQWTSTHRYYSNHDPGPLPKDHIPAMLRRHGYRAGLVGKNHTFLTEADFDVFEERPQPEEGPARRAHDEWMKANAARYARLFEEPIPGGIDADPMHAKTTAALRFLEANRARPFFLELSYLYPHTPYHAPEPYFSLYRGRDLGTPVAEPRGLKAAGKPFRHVFHQRNNDAILPFTARQTELMRQVYCGMITLVDAEVGRILRFLDERNLAENTLVVFTSDHGDYLGDHGLYTKSPALYDCLVRVPLVLRWPGVADQNRRDPRFASHVDVMPTLAAAARVPCPAQAQGVNLAPFLSDRGQGPPIREAAISEYGAPGRPYDEARLAAEGIGGKRFRNPSDSRLPWEGNPVSLAGRIRMSRTQKWKYVEEAGGTDELYDLEADPHELVNLAARPSYRPVLRKLKEGLAKWKAGIPGVEVDLGSG